MRHDFNRSTGKYAANFILIKGGIGYVARIFSGAF